MVVWKGCSNLSPLQTGGEPLPPPEGVVMGESQPMPGSSDKSEDVTPVLIRDIQQHAEVTGFNKHKIAAIEALIKQRTEVGIQSYGTSLQTWNGRAALWDAREECADMCQYLEQILMERPTNAKYRVMLWNAIALLFMVMDE